MSTKIMENMQLRWSCAAEKQKEKKTFPGRGKKNKTYFGPPEQQGARVARKIPEFIELIGDVSKRIRRQKSATLAVSDKKHHHHHNEKRPVCSSNALFGILVFFTALFSRCEDH